jgi:hypothetical protein
MTVSPMVTSAPAISSVNTGARERPLIVLDYGFL